MKVMERFFLVYPKLLWPSQDLLQFSYQPNVSVDNAVISLQQKAHSSLYKPNTSICITLFDFSSTFNTIQPRLLRGNLVDMQVDSSLIAWITHHLMG